MHDEPLGDPGGEGELSIAMEMVEWEPLGLNLKTLAEARQQASFYAILIGCEDTITIDDYVPKEFTAAVGPTGGFDVWYR